jgi:hypothetical protein
MLDQTVLAERLNPEERKKLFQETSARLTQKLTEEDIDQIENWRKNIDRYWGYLHYSSALSLHGFYYNRKSRTDDEEENLKVYLKKECAGLKKTIKSFPLFETWLLYNYEMKTRIVNGGSEHILPSFTDEEKTVLTRFRYFPWEKARMLRIFNWQLDYHIVMSYSDIKNRFIHDHKEYFKNLNKRYKKVELITPFGAFLNRLPREWSLQPDYFSVVIGNRLRIVHSALHLWYLEHDHTLPKSLDELVGTYLDEIPRDPRTGTVMEYFPHGNDSLAPDDYLFRLNYKHKSNCPYLKLEATVLDLHFLLRID